MSKSSNIVSLPYIDKSKVTGLFWLIAISGALGGFAAGYDTGVIGDALNVISIKLTTSEIGLSASGLLLGSNKTISFSSWYHFTNKYTSQYIIHTKSEPFY